MTLGADSRALDAAYKPFPTFEQWQSGATVTSQRWLRNVRQLAAAKQVSATVLARAAEVAKRAAAFDTGALENLYETDRGFTYSVAMETAAWELGLLERGEQVRPLFNAQMQAYDFVLDLATTAEPVSEAALRKLHEVICAAQETYQVVTAVGPQNQPLPKGQYKSLANHVRTREGEDHSYAPVDMTPPEMFRLVQELRSEAFLAAHPILQASYAHYCFVVIHPFADGNGRVARALASLYTYRAASVPIIILTEYKPEYLDALATADGGEAQVFVDFLLARALDTMQLVEESFQGADKPSREEAMQALEGMYYTKSGFSPERVDQLGLIFSALFEEELRNQFPDHPAYQANIFSLISPITTTPPLNYRSLLEGKTRYIGFTLEASLPAKGVVARGFELVVPRAGEAEEDLLLMPTWNEENKFPHLLNETRAIASARCDELDPIISGFLKIRLKISVERLSAENISELLSMMKKS